MPRPTQSLIDNLRTNPNPGVPVTIDDVVVKSGAWLGFALVAATVGWFTATTFLSVVSPLVMIGLLVGLTFLDFRIYKAPTPPNGLMALSLGLYGYVVGAFSWAYSTAFDGGGMGLIGSAAAGTVVTAAVVIGLYKARILRAETAKFRSMVISAGIGYMVIVGLSLLIQVFGGGSLFGPGILGWVLCLFGTAMAALSLTLAAADIDMAIRQGAPNVEASRLGWAFVSTLLWLYLEILRLLSRLRD